MRTVLSLGDVPLANALPRPEELPAPEPRFPLGLMCCEACGLVQLTHTVPPEQLFRTYLYFSSYSDAFVAHAARIAERVIDQERLGRGSLVVEVASNDGYLLQHFVRRGVPVLGIEPARNVAAAAEAKGIPTLPEFFGADLAAKLRADGRLADAVFANNVMAHVPDIHGFVEGIRLVLRDGGLAVIEVPYVKDLVDRREFDTIYHEHVFYFSATVLDGILRQHGLVLQDVERIPVHGGSLRLFVRHPPARPTERVAALLREEAGWRATDPGVYADFGRAVEALREDILGTLRRLRSQGKRVAAYGAAAKATVLLNYCGIGPDLVDYVVDRSPHKQGRFVPGVRLPIHAPSRLLEDQPDYTLLLAWNFADEILAQQSAYRGRGGRFIVPVPQVAILP